MLINTEHNIVCPDPSTTEEYFHQVITLCEEWKSDKDSFEIQTSGSTGKPKKIHLTREQMKASARATIEALGLVQGERFLIALNTAYIAGLLMLVRGMELQAEMVVIPPQKNPLSLFEEDKDWFDFTALVPMQLNSILEETPEKISILKQMKTIIVGGAPVSYSLLKKIRKITRVPIYATYGMTETVTHIALKRLNGKRPSDNYFVLPNVVIKTDERGCLVINAPKTLGEDIITNDLVEIVNEKEFRWLSRWDFVINTGGVKVFPEKVESYIERLFYEMNIKQTFFVTGVDDEVLGKKVALVVEGKSFEKKFENELLENLKRNLPTYHAPKSIIYVDELIRTPTNKIDKRKNTDLLKIQNPSP